jgi:hypothetical protein
MNPQKLAGQCAKLKCCINYEVDAYVEAQKKLPSREVALETKDNTYYHFKTDVFKREITYSTDKTIAANLVTISASRAFEIIGMNKKGIKPTSLEYDNKQKTQKRDAQDILGQESVTRFDSMKKKKKKKNSDRPQDNSSENKESQPKIGEKTVKPIQPENKKEETGGGKPKNNPENKNKEGRPSNNPNPNKKKGFRDNRNRPKFNKNKEGNGQSGNANPE